MQNILTDLQEHSSDGQQKLKVKIETTTPKRGLQTCIHRVKYFSYLDKKQLLVSYYVFNVYVAQREESKIYPSR